MLLSERETVAMATPESLKNALSDNFNVDYVIRYRYVDAGTRALEPLLFNSGCV